MGYLRQHSSTPASPDVTEWTEARSVPHSPDLSESWIVGPSPVKAKQLLFDDDSAGEPVRTIPPTPSPQETDTSGANVPGETPAACRKRITFDYDAATPNSQASNSSNSQKVRNTISEPFSFVEDDELATKGALKPARFSFHYDEFNSQSQNESSPELSTKTKVKVTNTPKVGIANDDERNVNSRKNSYLTAHLNTKGRCRENEFAKRQPASVRVVNKTNRPLLLKSAVNYSILDATKQGPTDSSRILSKNTRVLDGNSVAAADVTMTPILAPSLFTTGSGKSVHISSKAMTEAAKQMNDDSADPPSLVPKTPVLVPAHSLFTTGSGKSVHISSKAMTEAAKQMDDNSSDPPSLVPKTPVLVPAPSLFTTGSGKSVHISSKAMTEAAKQMDDDSSDPPSPTPKTPVPAPSLFTTGSGKSVPISSKAMAEAAKQMNEDSADPPPLALKTPAPTPSLFTTGSGKSVCISSKAIAEAAEILKEPPEIHIAKETASMSKGPGESGNVPIVTRTHVDRSIESSNGGRSGINVGSTEPRLTSTPSQASISSRSVKRPSSVTSGIRRPGLAVGPRGRSFKSPRPAGVSASQNGHVRETLARIYPGSENNLRQLQSSTSIGHQKGTQFSTPLPQRRLRFQTPRPDDLNTNSQKLTFSAPQPQKREKLEVCSQMNRKTPERKGLSTLGNLPKRSDCVRVALSFDVSKVVLQISSNNSWLVKFHHDTGIPLCIADESQGPYLSALYWREFLLKRPDASNYIEKPWLVNHMRWIVWKLAAMERMFPASLNNFHLTHETMMDQLCGRYQREQIDVQRSALRKILEKDLNSKVHMVLCVARIQEQGNGMVALELTDGWYSIDAKVGAQLSQLVKQGRIAVGQKIQVSGAQMTNNDSGLAPLQCVCNNPLARLNPTEVARLSQPLLSIDVNNTKPAPWYAKLGLCHPMKVPKFLKSLSSVHVSGGTVPSLEVVIDRVYPLVFREKLPNGQCIFRDEAQEAKANEESRQKDFEKKQEQLRSCIDAQNRSGGLVGVHEMQQMQEQVQRDFEHGDTRDVSSFVRLRVAQYYKQDKQDVSIRKAELTMWDATPDLVSTLLEGHKCTLSNLRVSSGPRGQLRLLTNRQSRWIVENSVCSDAELAASGFKPRQVDTFNVLLNRMGNTLEEEEVVDTMFVVVRCENSLCFVADTSGLLAVVESCRREEDETCRFPSELQKEGRVVAAKNLSFVGRDPHVPLLRFKWSVQRSVVTARFPTSPKAQGWGFIVPHLQSWQQTAIVQHSGRNVSCNMPKDWMLEKQETLNDVLHNNGAEVEKVLQEAIASNGAIASGESIAPSRVMSPLLRGESSHAKTTKRYRSSVNTSTCKRAKPSSAPTLFAKEIWVTSKILSFIMLARITTYVQGQHMVENVRQSAIVRFRCGKLFQDCKVVSCQEFKCLEDLVEHEEIKQIVGEQMSKGDAIALLRSRNAHKRGANAQLNAGVLAITIEVVESQN